MQSDVYDPHFQSYYNKFYLDNENGQYKLLMEDGSVFESDDPYYDARDLFFIFHQDPKFSTMVALTDSRGNNLVFYDSDKNKIYSNRL